MADQHERNVLHGGALRIAHCFADVGVESEALAAYGDVYRYSIDPMDSPYNVETVQMDLRSETPDRHFDLAVFHPPCHKWTQRRAEDAENLIPRARELGQEIADEYIIENQPDAPLKPPEGGCVVTLHGAQFGLPVAYERAFELSYEVAPPPRRRGWAREHRVENTRPRQYWKAVKGYVGEYPAKDFILNSVPSDYIRCLVRPLLDGYDGLPTSQQSLTEVATDGGQ